MRSGNGQRRSRVEDESGAASGALRTKVHGVGPLQKGFKVGAIGFLSSVVIGVASTAPGYSIAASLGVVAASVGLHSPAIMLLAFVPMFLIAGAYYAMNRVDPDCGTTFVWVTRAIGPKTGWISGWAVLIANVLAMASLSQIAGSYTFLLFDAQALAESKLWVTFAGVVWIALMTWICYIGIEISARTQWFLLAAELIILGLFAAVALVRVHAGAFPDAVTPSIDWLNPFSVDSTSALTAGVLTAVFLYWGWDTAVSVNEETKDATRTPGLAAVTSTLLLIAIYVIVSIAATAVHGPAFLVENQEEILSPLGRDVMPGWLGKLLIVAVLTSASACTQTTILPATRSLLSMASHRAAPQRFGLIHERYLTPGFATLWIGVISSLYYVALSFVSDELLADSITATGLMISFYLGMTGVACVVYFRRVLFRDTRTFLLAGAGPLLGAVMFGWIFVRSVIDLADPAASELGHAWLGVGPPLAITFIALVLGLVLAALQWRTDPTFFRRTREAAPADHFKSKRDR